MVLLEPEGIDDAVYDGVAVLVGKVHGGEEDVAAVGSNAFVAFDASIACVTVAGVAEADEKHPFPGVLEFLVDLCVVVRVFGTCFKGESTVEYRLKYLGYKAFLPGADMVAELWDTMG